LADSKTWTISLLSPISNVLQIHSPQLNKVLIFSGEALTEMIAVYLSPHASAVRRQEALALFTFGSDNSFAHKAKQFEIMSTKDLSVSSMQCQYCEGAQYLSTVNSLGVCSGSEFNLITFRLQTALFPMQYWRGLLGLLADILVVREGLPLSALFLPERHGVCE